MNDQSEDVISKLRSNIDLIDQIDIATSLALVALRIDDAARPERLDRDLRENIGKRGVPRWTCQNAAQRR